MLYFVARLYIVIRVCKECRYVSLKGCQFEHTELSIHIKSFNDKCAIVKEAQVAYLLSQDSNLTQINLQLIGALQIRPPLS